MRPPKKRTWRFYVGYAGFLVLVLAAALEIGLRIFGAGTWRPVEKAFSVEPGGRMFMPDSLLGFRGKPGKFSCTIDGKLHFGLTHDTLGFRISSRNHIADTLPKPEIWIFGCSFTHGYGVEDSAAWPWQAQQMLPGFRIRNFAMTAYSTYQSLLLFDSMLRQSKTKPHCVVLAYGSFHDQRNTASRFWRKALFGQQAAADIQYPYVAWDTSSSTGYRRQKGHLDYQPWFGQRWSALLHAAEIRHDHAQERLLHTKEISLVLVKEMKDLALAHANRFVIAGIQHGQGDWAPLKPQPQEKNFRVIDISQDLSDASMRILPEDGHPNAKAHLMMATAFAKEFMLMESE